MTLLPPAHPSGISGNHKKCRRNTAGVLIALDRQEKGLNDSSAIQEVQDRFNMPVIA